MFHMKGQSLKMRQKFHVVICEMYIRRAWNNLLQTLLRNSKWWTSLHGVVHDQTKNKQKNGNVLWKDTQIGKLFVRKGKWKLVHHFNSCNIGTILTNHNCGNENRHFVWTQRSY